jgi:hypothetical protein
VTDLELTVLATDLAAEGVTPLKAFVACQEAGMTSVKRADFEKKYQSWVESAFQRALDRRNSRENDFRERLKAFVLSTAPSEETVMPIAAALSAALQAPWAVPGCITMAGGNEALLNEFRVLWPHLQEDKNEPGGASDSKACVPDASGGK